MVRAEGKRGGHTWCQWGRVKTVDIGAREGLSEKASFTQGDFGGNTKQDQPCGNPRERHSREQEQTVPSPEE